MGIEAKFLKLIETRLDDNSYLGRLSTAVEKGLHNSLPRPIPTHIDQAEYVMAHVTAVALAVIFDAAKDQRGTFSDPVMIASSIFENIGLQPRKLTNSPEESRLLFSKGRNLSSQVMKMRSSRSLISLALDPRLTLAKSALQIITDFPQTFDASLARYPHDVGTSEPKLDETARQSLSRRNVYNQKLALADEFPSLRKIIFLPAPQGAPEASPAP